jgi:tetratricopeptide (TPR) repeat protein
MTGAFWRSVLVATVFAIHPLRVESVAWVTERKDVLSGLFFVLTLGAYTAYARRAISRPFHALRYGLVLMLFAFGLLSKSMLVTVPVVLLLLDFWPLGRIGSADRANLRCLFIEKLPFFALALLFSIIQLVAARDGILSVNELPMSARFANALISYGTYIVQTFYPAGLAAFYPHAAGAVSLGQAALALAGVVAVSIAAWIYRKERPWIAVGWLWYLVMLLPVIGIIQSGELARADRYTYLPQIGLLIALVWTIAEGFARTARGRVALATVAIAAITGLAVTAHRQTSRWRDTETLWRHALSVTAGNYIAHDNLGRALMMKQRKAEAIVEHRRALEINPRYAIAANNAGLLLQDGGQLDEALSYFEQAISADPQYALAHHNLGNALFAAGRIDDAIAHQRRALEILPQFSRAECNLGIAYQRTGRVATAITHYERAIKIDPSFAGAYGNLGSALVLTGRLREAMPHLTRALALAPDVPTLQNNLAWVLATSTDVELRDGARAVELASKAVAGTSWDDPMCLMTLGAAYAETGHFSDALETARKALSIAEARTNRALADTLRGHIRIYEANEPVRTAR